MKYTVRPGDTLWSIARRQCNDGLRWHEIARANNLPNADRLFVGQMLTIADSLVERIPGHHAAGDNDGFMGAPRAAGATADSARPMSPMAQQPALIPSANYVFVLADELDPTRAKVVRRVMVNPKMAQVLGARLGRTLPLFPQPERFGFMPTAPDGRMSLGQHARGFKPSPYSSASTKQMGATRFAGTSFWIDVAKAEQAGASFHETSEILADLDRLAAKAADAASKDKIIKLKSVVTADAEILIKGPIPATAIKGPAAMAMTRGLQGVQIVGFAMSAVNIAHATEMSIRTESARPIAAEAVRQVGGWAAAWAGMKLGAAGGALLGIETGPGAVLTGALGGIAGGVLGYYGFDWAADQIDAD